MDCKEQASKNITDRLTWHTAIKDQAGIAGELAEGQPVREVYGLGDAGLFDDFFCFLEKLGFTNLFANIQLKANCKYTT